MTQERMIFIEECGFDLSRLDGPRTLFCHMRDCCPERTCVIAANGIEWPSVYMDIILALAHLAGIKDEVKRVIADRSPESQEQIELVFYWKDERFQWSFKQTFKYLSEEFWEKARRFFEQRATRNIILVSVADEPFLELASLSSADLVKIQCEGWSLPVFVQGAQRA